MSDPNPPIYREVVRDLRINPFTPIERYRAWTVLKTVPWYVYGVFPNIIRSEN